MRAKTLLLVLFAIRATAFLPPPARISRAPALRMADAVDFDYLDRQVQFGLADKAAVLEAKRSGAAVWLDVRSDGEVAAAALPAAFTHIPVDQIDARAAELPADKAAQIVCFCGVGGRVVSAKRALEAMGYTNVLNAGGLKDVVGLFA